MRFLHPIAVVAIAIGAATLAAVVGNDYYLRIGFMMCVYYLCAAGMNVLVGYAGQKSLGQAGLFAAGAYGAALLSTSFDLNAWLALVAAAVIAGICGVLIAWPSLRVRGPYLAMVTLAFGIVVEKLVSEWTDVFGGAEGIYGIAVARGNSVLEPALGLVWNCARRRHAPALAEPALRPLWKGVSFAPGGRNRR